MLIWVLFQRNMITQTDRERELSVFVDEKEDICTSFAAEVLEKQKKEKRLMNERERDGGKANLITHHVFVGMCSVSWRRRKGLLHVSTSSDHQYIFYFPSSSVCLRLQNFSLNPKNSSVFLFPNRLHTQTVL